MKKFLILITLLILLSACKSSSHNCDAYGYVENTDIKNNI